MALFACAASGFAACSDGEEGIVLGRLHPNGSSGAPIAGSGAGHGGSFSLGGESLQELGGDAGTPPEADAGAAGAPPLEPPWVEQRCHPVIEYSNQDQTSQGATFDRIVPNVAEIIWPAARAACSTLYRAASEVRPVSKLYFVLRDYDGVASAGDTTMELSSSYVQRQSDAGGDVRLEITGILHFTTTLVYQYPDRAIDDGNTSWIITGTADYVRLHAGYLDPTRRSKGVATPQASTSRAVAYFFDYLSQRNPDLVYLLNQRRAPGAPAWNDDYFQTLFGEDLPTLWASYQATF